RGGPVTAGHDTVVGAEHRDLLQDPGIAGDIGEGEHQQGGRGVPGGALDVPGSALDVVGALDVAGDRDVLGAGRGGPDREGGTGGAGQLLRAGIGCADRRLGEGAADRVGDVLGRQGPGARVDLEDRLGVGGGVLTVDEGTDLRLDVLALPPGGTEDDRAA